MKIYNSLTREKQEFVPIEEGKVKIYACGPTVYNYIHIGNARPLCVFDVLRRYLEYRGYEVKFVQNFTDVDDKIINKANDENTDYISISEKFIDEYKKDAKALNIKEATIHPRATENIDVIIDMIKNLIEKDYAYVSKCGDVYFRTNKFNDYGKLSHQPLEDLEAGARIRVGEEKENPMDFALWKACKPGEPMWEAPWGNGRPGWHIECSAMAKKYLGDTIDIHCGGQDLIFPHHENEIAQSECCNSVQFANYWMHNGYINVDNRKMSKSLNNFFTVREIGEKFGCEPIRYLMVASHYRSPINYSLELIHQSKAALERLYNFRDNLIFKISKSCNEESSLENLDKRLEEYKTRFIKAMDDDLNTADAISVIFDFIRDFNTDINSDNGISKNDLKALLKTFDEFTQVLGLVYNNKDSINEEIEKLISDRNQARKEKDWKKADGIRDKLKEVGVILEDTKQGVKWRLEK